ncbi:MAG: hypothetical protein NTW79_02745, partial [Candidatus Berkelbacteria bacterium]|nr:hypothetical protein [Candidatus Berkelbacteria bacterium]
MNETKKGILINRWTIVLIFGFGIFWVIWYLIHGNVPKTEVGWPNHYYYVSRWWDILAGIAWSDLIFNFIIPRIGKIKISAAWTPAWKLIPYFACLFLLFCFYLVGIAFFLVFSCTIAATTIIIGHLFTDLIWWL